MSEKVKADREPKTVTNDDELLLMGRINRQLLKLDPEARTRVLDWLCSRHGVCPFPREITESKRSEPLCRALSMSGA